MNGDEFGHLIRQFAGQQQSDFRPLVYGHIANYDATLHRIQAIIPSFRDDDPAPVLSPWMSLGSLMAGNGWGLQIAPLGGATLENPTAGEQVIIGLFNHSNGGTPAAVMSVSWNESTPAPGSLAGGLAAGEAVLRHSSGTYFKLAANGDLIENSAHDIVQTATHDVAISAVDISIHATGTVTVSGQKLILSPAPPTGPGTGGQVWNHNGTLMIS